MEVQHSLIYFSIKVSSQQTDQYSMRKMISNKNKIEIAYSKSLDLLHSAQTKALRGEISTSLLTLRKSIRLWSTYKKYDRDWYFYLLATFSYLKGNRDRLLKLQPLAGYNADVTLQLLRGLSEYGFPNYLRDYILTRLSSKH